MYLLIFGVCHYCFRLHRTQKLRWESSPEECGAGGPTPTTTGAPSEKKKWRLPDQGDLEGIWKTKSLVIPCGDKITRRLRSTHPGSSTCSMITTHMMGPLHVTNMTCAMRHGVPSGCRAPQHQPAKYKILSPLFQRRGKRGVLFRWKERIPMDDHNDSPISLDFLGTVPFCVKVQGTLSWPLSERTTDLVMNDFGLCSD